MKHAPAFLFLLSFGLFPNSGAWADDTAPDSSILGPQLAATVVGTYHSPPRQIGSQKMADGPVVGNGDLGVMAGGSPDKLSFYFGKADFFGNSERGRGTGRLGQS